MEVGRLGRLVGAMVLGGLGAGPALAATVAAPQPSGTACLGASLTFNGAPTPCLGIYSGNDSNQDLDGLFGYDWDFAAKDETPGADDEGDFGLTASGGASGTWSVDDWLGYETVMVVLKGGPTFSAFLIEDTSLGGALGGLFNTQSNLKGNGRRGPGLSHVSLYTTGEPVAPVPLPAAGLLLAVGLGGLAALRRRG